jgi:hypothetical protein
MIGTYIDSCNNKYTHNTPNNHWYEMPIKINQHLAMHANTLYTVMVFHVSVMLATPVYYTYLPHAETARLEQLHILQVKTFKPSCTNTQLCVTQNKFLSFQSINFYCMLF